MRNETDLDGVKSVAKMLLMTKVNKTPFSPMVVQHPFTNTGIVGLPKDGGQELEILDITAERKNLARWQAMVEKQIDWASDPFQIYMMVNPPYGLTFLKYAEPYLSQEDYTHILGSAWVMCEAPHNDPDLGVSKLIAMFQKVDPTLLMDEDEYAAYQEMDDTVTVYRGVTSYNAKNIRALSWTTSRETAQWFAHRFGEQGTVYETQIDKAHIFAYLSDRSEAEVILDPRYLADISEAQDMASDFLYHNDRRTTMTIYQEEMQRKAQRRGCDCYPHEETGNLQICYNGRQIGEVAPKGNLLFPRPNDAETEALIDGLCEDAKLVREYVDIYESAPPMACADVSEYRKFSEFGDIVFAGMYSQKHGFMFCTWSQGDAGRYLTHGHYTPDYEAAKEDYATRTNLISNDRLFNLEQSGDLYRCISYARDYCDAITYEKDRELMMLLDKLLDAYPQLEESCPSFDESEAPQMNL